MAERRVLVVDDDPDVAELHARRVAAVEGFRLVGVAHTGVDAVRAVGELAPDLVLLDVHLPDISGVEVLHRVRTPSAGSAAPGADTAAAPDVIVISAASDRIAVGQALAAGVADYIVKPVSASELARRLRQYRDLPRNGVPDAVAGSLEQRSIDALVAAGTGPIRTVPSALLQRLPKGLSEPTARAILNSVPLDVPRPAAWIAERAGVSRITARRYLELLRTAGVVELSHRYGVPGRPEQRFLRTSD
ncbi:response regulator [Mycetocola reblochoni]|uniref:Response regulator CitB of citrate metabolism n=2 Tax=Mycetocola reblochoni TaxID=331618 RepID=A0A1R4JA65_9MICO|nr:response regulator [Mycetocola reblochoni]SJN28938.1 Response regulator CitB of citrate metabolism [Mycetocola reblochoni REB411]